MAQNEEILLSHITQSYGRKTVLSDLSMTIPKGMFGLLGRNGAGKTTLLRTISGLIAPKKGSISLYGTDGSNLQAVRKLIGYLPQEFSFYPSMTCLEALDYLAVLSGLSKSQRKERIPLLLSQVGLWEKKSAKFRTLSGGMKRRLGIAQALLHDPKIVVTDEPTAGLDPEERVRFRKLFLSLSEKKTVILSTHIVEDIEKSCEDLAVLDKGRLLYAGKTDRFLERYGAGKMESAYLACIHAKEDGGRD